jgi:hypothetical protein
MSEWYETRVGLWDQAWRVLEAGLSLRDAPARQPTFATVSPGGWPEARTVVLRAADKARAVLEVHTDLHSSKIASLRRTPRAALHLWEPELQLQVRMQADVDISSGEAVAETWASVPDPSRQSYGITPAPGTPIADALDYVKAPDPATFAVLSCQLSHVDLVHLGVRHRRAAFARSRDWQGQWLAP